MDTWKCKSPACAPSLIMAPLNFSNKVHEKAQSEKGATGHVAETEVDIDHREVYFLIMHFLSTGPCQKTFGQFCNELLEHHLLPRRYHAWFSRSGAHNGDDSDDGISFPLSYNNLVERYTCLLYCSTRVKFQIQFSKKLRVCLGLRFQNVQF
jgi:PH-interacting protein